MAVAGKAPAESPSEHAMTNLARKLRLVDYFALGFGTMVGTAWLMVMDDVLERGGPLGAIIGFTAGALMLLPIGYVYGKLVKMVPDAAAEVASALATTPSIFHTSFSVCSSRYFSPG